MNTTSSRPPRARKRQRIRFLHVLLLLALAVIAAVVAGAVTPTTRWAHGTGYLITDREVELCPSVEGPIASALVPSGALVSAADVLIQLHDEVQRAALDESQGRLEAQRASLQSLISSQQLDEAQRLEQIKQAQMNQALAQNQYERMSGQAGFSPKEIEEAKLRLELADSRLAELSAPREQMRHDQIAVLEQQIIASQNQVARLTAELEQRKIRAPIDGTVHFHRFEPGEVVKPEDVLGQVFDRSAWVIKLQLPERDLPYLEAGQPAEVYLAAHHHPLGAPLPARVGRIDPVITPRATGDGVFLVELTLPPPDGLVLSPGMTAWSDIDTGRTTWLRRLLGL